MIRTVAAFAAVGLIFGAAETRAQEPTPAGSPVNVSPAVRTGAVAGPVQLTVFCDIEEGACQRLVVVLRRVVETHPELVGVTFRHHAAEDHKQSPLAYRSALAAGRQGRGWEMLDMACANPDRLNREGLRSMAAQLRIDEGRFLSDIEAPDIAQRLEDDATEAQALDVAKVPAMFLNGARVPDPSTFDAIDAAVKAAIK